MAIINVIAYAGPFPVNGSYNPVTSQLDDAGPFTHRLISQQLVIPIVASSDDELASPDTQTFVRVLDGQVNFVVDGNPVGNVVWDTGMGMPKWTLGGGVDPIYYQGTPQTIAQRNALVAVNPLAKRGWLVYVVDVGIEQYQAWNGSVWVPVGGSSSKVVETLTIASRNSINNLGSLPTSPVEFHVNGVLARTGITNVNQVVTVDEVAIGFNIDPLIDSVIAVYNV